MNKNIVICNDKMSDIKYSNLESSSLVDLKAELFKKQEAVKLAKLNQSNETLKRKGFKLKGQEAPKKIKNKKILLKPNICAEEEAELQRSRLALERKAKLYEQIISKKVSLDDDESETYMVDFHRKLMNNEVVPCDTEKANLYKVEESSQKGQTIYHPSLVPKPNPYENNFVRSSTDNSILKSVPSVQDGNEDGPIHYQNVQFNEVRDHGVGYFAFSTSEAERKTQMDSLNSLRQQTERKQAAYKTAEVKQKAALQARLAKICKRRNIDESAVDKFITKSDTEDDNVNSLASDVDLTNIPLPEGNPVPITTVAPEPVKVRPWDEGKRIVGSEVIIEKPNKAIKRDYVEDRRSERIEEFAPPSLYSWN